MLVGAIDAPILHASRHKLGWIVLDEAHTYVGSQAAELALLLRRVMQAFDVDPVHIRLVATSATISRNGATARLASFEPSSLMSLASNRSVSTSSKAGEWRSAPCPAGCR
jgi:ATP-dependent helicase YprA (DUF1998 family)